MALRSPSILGVVAITGLLLGATMLSGCAVDRETTLSRTARQRQLQALKVQRERLDSEREVLVRRAGETRAEIGTARAESIRAEARLRATLADLGHELGQLQVAEQDLAAARARAQEIERELKPLRALEQTLRDQAALKAAAEEKVKLLQQELKVTEAAAAKVSAELQPKVDALKAELGKAQDVSKAITDAQTAMQAAAKLMVPPPPEPKPPAKAPAKK